MDALLYLARTGCQLRHLPNDFPSWPTVYGYFTWWRDDGMVEKTHDALRVKVRQAAGRRPEPTAGLIYSQSAGRRHPATRGGHRP